MSNTIECINCHEDVGEGSLYVTVYCYDCVQSLISERIIDIS